MGDRIRFGGISSTLAIALGAALLGFAGGWAWQVSGAGRGATETIVRDYILDHPEILPQAMQRMQQRELAARLAPLRGALENPYPGAVLGNPNGTVTLVEFSDYACPYCRLSVPEVEALIAANKDLKVVLREEAVLSPQSEDAARMALAAADQGRYAAFHKAMFSHDHLSPETIDAAARAAGLDLAKAKAAIASGKYDSEIENNGRVAEAAGFSGTPAWVIGDEGFSGALSRDVLAQAVMRARAGK
ncbi:MAG: DsbA family protein [Candidatus Andeanibacterium colombiense]|uniref:DsbA family protein n=1 Tax=Candidatus Andeanibacterium colombiense TaxID=3121345 RepID=A0AAJ5X3I3_9SPHN|nr:MAG: DsbA family protein [Sphingomonadaceae bacterium]